MTTPLISSSLNIGSMPSATARLHQSPNIEASGSSTPLFEEASSIHTSEFDIVNRYYQQQQQQKSQEPQQEPQQEQQQEDKSQITQEKPGAEGLATEPMSSPIAEQPHGIIPNYELSHQRYSFEYSNSEAQQTTTSSSCCSHLPPPQEKPQPKGAGLNQSLPLASGSNQQSKFTSFTFQPPKSNLLQSHGYQSSISSISSTGSVNSSPGNFSPNQARKLHALHQSRNTKNLSLNLMESNGSSTMLQQPSFGGKRVFKSVSSALDTPTASQTEFAKDGHHQSFSVTYAHEQLQTPSVTHTPQMPPARPKQEYSSCKNTRPIRAYKFPPVDSEFESSSLLINDAGDSSMMRHNDERIVPPAPPPFALNSKSSPLNTPPRLQSPTTAPSTQQPSSPSRLSKNIKKMAIESPLATNFTKDITTDQRSNDDDDDDDDDDSSLHTSQNVTYNTSKFKEPEELQESSAINAYPNGPRSVLNNLVFLYSDPDNKIDINEYNLVINVAKECKKLSHLYKCPQPNFREYIHIPWSHTSNISKNLTSITSKIESFFSRGLKVLVHCQCGVSRSACVIVAFFMRKFNIGVNEAYEMLKSGHTAGSGKEKIVVDKCDRICPNMSLIFELMEFGDYLNHNEYSTSQLFALSPSQMNL
ncbi:uncharacterized protein LODBEIA_P07470 [Lodderomyces beijingensis]|uniref:protein-tyrosine-phosphatase n=1 Tax=Lodderomyces beijingensis TaxID=1775926 RepID=A0ABP0ZED2_9ASCO